jgi:choline dehydrogenase
MSDAGFDYVIIGAGSSGCVLANRLSEDPETRVLLLEAGTKDSDLLIRMPAGWAKVTVDERYVRLHTSEPEANTVGRRHTLPRGHLLGGCSAVNGMIYIRGQAEDYDGWAAAGATGWDWHSVLPYFRRSEDQEHLRDEYHGVGGPLPVSDLPAFHPLSELVVRAFQEAGVPHNPDFNGARQEGVGYYQTTMRGGERWSTARAFLDPVRGRPNLKIVTGAHVERLLTDGRVVTGARYRHAGGSVEVKARREVLLAAGALDSPKLLMLSGIGPAQELQRHGIPLVHDLPAVGENLHDHFIVPMMFRLKPGSPSLNPRLTGLHLLWEGIRYLATHKGALAMPAAEVGVFARSDPSLTRPDIQFHCLPLTGPVNEDGTVAKQPDPWPGLTMGPCTLNPRARGRLGLRTTDPLAKPSFSLGYLQDEHDVRVTLAGMRLALKAAAQPSLASIMESVWRPAASNLSDDGLLDFARRIGVTTHHPVGTCRMGSDAAAVVDPQLRVNGIRGLRVVDASVIPILTSGNTNAPTIMIAERAADMIRGKIAT